MNNDSLSSFIKNIPGIEIPIIMDAHALIGFIKSPSLLNAETLKELDDLVAASYPYCSTLRVLLAKNHHVLKTEQASAIAKETAIFVPDRKKFFMFLHDIAEEEIIQPTAPVYHIGKLDDISGQEDATPLLQEKPVENDLIDTFIAKNPHISLKEDDAADDIDEDESEEPFEDEEFVSVILAEIYWKQGNQDKAIRIYEKLILKIPEKSSYFAAQIQKIKEDII